MNSILTLFTNKVEGKNRNPITNIMRKKFLPNRVGKNRILSQCDGKKFFPLRPTAVRGRGGVFEGFLGVVHVRGGIESNEFRINFSRIFQVNFSRIFRI